MNGGRTVAHRFGCSGIDGVTFAPRFGSGEEGDWLYVAYGIYGDTLRTDNDYQVLLAYDTKEWKRYEQPLSQSNLHKSGPAAPTANISSARATPLTAFRIWLTIRLRATSMRRSTKARNRTIRTGRSS